MGFVAPGPGSRKNNGRTFIPYKTAEGVADFHAAGRHTYITEWLRNGVSLVEARELARHSDVRMTMRYTHIGLEDQAQALTKLWGLGGQTNGTKSDEPQTSLEGTSHVEKQERESSGVAAGTAASESERS